MHRYLVGFLVVMICIFAEISPYPASNNEDPFHIDINEDLSKKMKNVNTLSTTEVPTVSKDSKIEEILEKIKVVNDGIQKPHRRQQVKWNPQPETGGGFTMDKEILEKLQQIIASGKLHGLPHEDNNNHDRAEISNYIRSTRQMNFPVNPLTISPYIMNMPVMVVPGGIYPGSMNGFNRQRDGNEGIGGSIFQWPFGQYFPILIRDPFLSIMNGDGWSNFIEYGQDADICRKQKSLDNIIFDEHEDDYSTESLKSEVPDSYYNLEPITEMTSRQAKTLKKRTVSQETPQPDTDNTKNNKKTLIKKPAPTKKPVFSIQQIQQLFDPASKDDVRFGWFGGLNNNNNKVDANNDNDLRRPAVVPSPGFFINRLKVRKGGVAIAGPGGVATAGRGGTAIVGPGGTALTQPGGMAVAGPAARIIALSADADLSTIINNLHRQQAASDGSVPFVHDIPEGRLVATGPVVYYHPKQSLRGREWRSLDGSYRNTWQWNDYGRRSDEFQYDGKRFVSGGSGPVKLGRSNFRLVLKPTANAQIARGTAIANPVSQIIVAKDKPGSIIHTPVASAIAGPGGIAHAQSDLYLYEYVTV